MRVAGGCRTIPGWPLDDQTSTDIACTLFESSDDALLIATADGTILTANPASCGLIGESRDVLTGETVAGLFQGDGVDVMEALRGLDGEQAQAATTVAGRPVLIHSFAVAKKAASHMLIRLRPAKPDTLHFEDLLACRTMKELLTHLPDALAAIDETGKVLMANEAFLALVAAPSEAETRFIPINRWLGANDGDAASMIAALQAGRKIASYPSVIWSEQGKRKQVKVWAIPALTVPPRCYGLLIRTDAAPAPSDAP
jgi:PAS domain-containing protein